MSAVQNLNSRDMLNLTCSVKSSGKDSHSEYIIQPYLNLSLPVTHICVNFPTVYNDTLVAKGLRSCQGLLF